MFSSRQLPAPSKEADVPSNQPRLLSTVLSFPHFHPTQLSFADSRNVCAQTLSDKETTVKPASLPLWTFSAVYNPDKEGYTFKDVWTRAVGLAVTTERALVINFIDGPQPKFVAYICHDSMIRVVSHHLEKCRPGSRQDLSTAKVGTKTKMDSVNTDELTSLKAVENPKELELYSEVEVAQERDWNEWFAKTRHLIENLDKEKFFLD
ncbi:MAG: hypothetical protein Q9168_002919 [Polycauliona sp. 1 TL-2023]